MQYHQFKPELIIEVEEKVKNWLVLDGSISLETTKQIINFLESQHSELSYYAYWQVVEYVKSFGSLEPCNFFVNWFTAKFGIKSAVKIVNLSENINIIWKQVNFKHGSIFEKLEVYRKANNLCVTQLLSKLAASDRDFVSSAIIEAMAIIPAPKTTQGIEGVACEFLLNVEYLTEILNFVEQAEI